MSRQKIVYEGFNLIISVKGLKVQNKPLALYVRRLPEHREHNVQNLAAVRVLDFADK